MKDPTLFKEMDLDNYEEELFMMHDPETTEADRIQKILDLQYAPADLEKEVGKIKGISLEQKSKVLNLNL